MSRHSFAVRCGCIAIVAREVEGQSSGSIHAASPNGGLLRPTNHRYGHNCGQDASMRTSSLLLDARAPNQFIGLACADPGHPRAALDMGDLWIANVLPQHPVESHGQLPGRRHLGHALRLTVATRLILLAKSIIQPGHALCRLPTSNWRRSRCLALGVHNRGNRPSINSLRMCSASRLSVFCLRT